eukprot:gb/GFBE01083199.1/.p1 GENE.gb/GFBE01083199.1/~~gb/GFBE01083199.1/.p1  ORF type:complete len:265 (+),score=36.87 gb/GFBE01083199.1/:1-795(+)
MQSGSKTGGAHLRSASDGAQRSRAGSKDTPGCVQGLRRRQVSFEHLDAESRERARQRVLLRAGLGISEHLAERLVERTAELATERVVEAQGARLLRKSVWSGMDRKFEQGAKSAFRRVVEGSGERRLSNSVAARESSGLRLICALRVTVTLLGTLLVLHMVHGDWHRLQEERVSKRRSRTAIFCFALATLMDLVDVFAHFIALTSLTAINIEEDILEHVESLSFKCAMAGTLALVVGELTSAVKPSGKHRAQPTLVATATAKDE